MDKIIEDKRWIKPKHLKIGIAVVIVLAAGLFLLLRNPVSVFKIEKSKISIDDVIGSEFHEYISVTGQVVPITSIYLDAVEGGRVEEIFIEEGAMLKKGDIILRLHNQDLKMNIMNSESSLAYQSNELRNTLIQMEQQKIANKRELLTIDYNIVRMKRKYEQNKELYGEELISKEEFLVSEEDYILSQKNRELAYLKMTQDSIFRSNQKQQMDENLVSMQRSLQMVRERLESLNVRAPFDGQLGLLNAELGEAINKGQRIGQINILESVKVKAEIDEHYIDKISSGLTGYFKWKTDTFNLRLKKQYPEVRNGRFEIDMVFKEEVPKNIRIGQTYNIKLELGLPQDAILIPRGAFFQETGGQWVYVLDPSGEFADRRNIKIGRQNPQYYEVLEGLKPGEQVIISSYSMFGDNERIIFK